MLTGGAWRAAELAVVVVMGLEGMLTETARRCACLQCPCIYIHAHTDVHICIHGEW